MNEPLHVRRRVQEEERLNSARFDVMEKSKALLDCMWHNSREQFDLSARQRHERKMLAQEEEQANKELVLQRRARLKEFLTAEAPPECPSIGHTGRESSGF